MEHILEKINQAAVQLLEPVTPRDVYMTVVKEAIKLVGASFGSIFLLRDGQLERVYSSTPILDKVKIRKKGFVQKTFQTQKTFTVDMTKVENIHPLLKQLNIRSVMLIPLSYRNKPMGVLTIQSIKEQHCSEKELSVLKIFGSMASLKIRNSHLYAEMEKALETRDLFISMAAHELRTPLTTIFGYVQLLQNKIQGDNQTVKKWLDELGWETQRLTKLINDILEINRVRKGQVHYIFRECNLREIIRRATDAFNLMHPNRRLIYQEQLKEGDDLVVGDSDKLLQLMINLLDNAYKFSFPDTDIIVSLKTALPYLKIGVADQGQGISKKELTKVFEAFYKGDYNKNQGMGLGLFLAKDIVEHHRGMIHLHSKKNLGTTVEINLPKTRLKKNKIEHDGV